MKKRLITTALFACGISVASASTNEVYEAKPLSASTMQTLSLNGKTYQTASTNLQAGTSLIDAKSGAAYTLTGEVVAELEPVINASEFAKAHDLNLVYVRGSRAIFIADTGADLREFKARIAALSGVLSTQFGIDIEGLEAE
ncbi:hypothetical protein C3B51_02440 [Pseudoalteromonas rubra]|uniref:ASP external chaperone domain-containing protein n=1 Tax=Pseudoalteromonas rubra TaxID=43658 RepID=A0A4Q7EM16_9GAMM|nr:hypothetical protein [Pseudoalteromonas rubra]RZM84696.1 hypothetical protein C3B51_02440 [Pseudoalteromonas rubra]